MRPVENSWGLKLHTPTEIKPPFVSLRANKSPPSPISFLTQSKCPEDAALIMAVHCRESLELTSTWAKLTNNSQHPSWPIKKWTQVKRWNSPRNADWWKASTSKDEGKEVSDKSVCNKTTSPESAPLSNFSLHVSCFVLILLTLRLGFDLFPSVCQLQPQPCQGYLLWPNFFVGPTVVLLASLFSTLQDRRL